MTPEIRSRFPILENKIYLASHSLGAVPRATLTALQEYYEAWASLGILAWEGPFLHAIAKFQKQIETLLEAEPGTVVPMENVTRGFAAVSSLWDWGHQKKLGKNRILMTDQEFLTSYPFFKGLERMGAELVILRSPDGIRLDTEEWIKALDERVLLVATSHVFFRSGFIQDLKTITKAAHKIGAFVLGDGYQAVGTVPVNVTELEVDFYVGGSHKWLCGGAGAGFLYVSPKILRDSLFVPSYSGWFGLEKPFQYQPGTHPVLSKGVNRFLAGTPSISALYAAREGLNSVIEVGLKKIRSHSIELTERIRYEGLKRGWTLRSPPSPLDRSGMICFDFEGAENLTKKLEADQVIIDYRPQAGIRISPHFYSNSSDIDLFFSKISS